MSTRKRKKVPAFRLSKTPQELEDQQDLKEVKAKLKKELEEDQGTVNEWLDKELAKNLKNQ